MLILAAMMMSAAAAALSLLALSICAFAMAALPCCLFLLNLRRFRAPADNQKLDTPTVAVLIPARNEEQNIRAALDTVLSSCGVKVQVTVYDDASTDGTAQLVQAYVQRDARVRLLPGVPLLPGWNGKQHACFRLAESTDASLLLFLDADVQLEPDAIARCVAEKQRTEVALLSGFPRIITETWMEWLLLPLIHFVLLGFLPMDRMRKTTKPAYAAGCGQFMLASREEYFACGGHAAIRETKHDGLRLPRLFREHGYPTDICDLTDLANVRMYHSAREVWNGLAKNANEGLGAPKRIAPLTLLLFVGQVLPLPLAVLWSVIFAIASIGARMRGAQFWNVGTALIAACACAMVTMNFVPRLVAARRFRQPLKSACLHPVGIVLLLCVQWYALGRMLLKKPVGWRGRS